MARNRRKHYPLKAPLLHEDHRRPVTRREFLGQGLISGGAFVLAPTLMNLISSPAFAATDSLCGLSGGLSGNKKIPFICFDLSGGANMAGSNVLVGGAGGQEDFISSAGYNKLGLPGDIIPSAADTLNGLGDHVYRDIGLKFHTDSAFLRGIVSKTSATTRTKINGAVIPARSDNDTANNPHNPMYGIAKAGANGDLLNLIGTRNSDSGGNSMAPADMIDLTQRPTKVDRPSDATGLVDTGQLGTMMPNKDEAGAVMEAIQKISFDRISNRADTLSTTKITTEEDVSKRKSLQDLVDCSYRKTSYTVINFGNVDDFDPGSDVNIVDDSAATATVTSTNADSLSTILGAGFADPMPIFTSDEFNNGTFSKTASVMKLVANGLAGAGTIQMGGFDYHTGDRATGELRDFEAGQAIGATLEYAARVGKPMMVYVFTDGSLASNGSADGTVNGRGKGVWTGDNSSTSAAFFLVYNPSGRPSLLGGSAEEQARHQQIGYFRDNGSVETTATTPGANNVNLLVQMLVLNYMALNGDQGNFTSAFPDHGLGSDLDKFTAFAPIV
jgi:hypothetical protein